MTVQTTTRAAAQGVPHAGVLPQEDSSAKLLGLVMACMDDAKAENVVSLDIREKSSIGDFMVIASGRSQRHVGAVADQIVQKLKEHGYRQVRVEGMPSCDWVLVDAGDVIVHLFRPEVREFYNLEKMWSADRPIDVVAS